MPKSAVHYIKKKPTRFSDRKAYRFPPFISCLQVVGSADPSQQDGWGNRMTNKQTKLTENEMGPKIQDDIGNHGTALFERVR